MKNIGKNASSKKNPVSNHHEDPRKNDNMEKYLKHETTLQNICTLVCCYDTNGNGIIEEGEFKHLMEQLEARFGVSKESKGRLSQLMYNMKEGIEVQTQSKTGHENHFNWTTKQIVQILYYFFTEGAEDDAFKTYQLEKKKAEEDLKNSILPQR
jgi:hypothetical protein